MKQLIKFIVKRAILLFSCCLIFFLIIQLISHLMSFLNGIAGSPERGLVLYALLFCIVYAVIWGLLSWPFNEGANGEDEEDEEDCAEDDETHYSIDVTENELWDELFPCKPGDRIYRIDIDPVIALHVQWCCIDSIDIHRDGNVIFKDSNNRTICTLRNLITDEAYLGNYLCFLDEDEADELKEELLEMRYHE